MAGEIHRIALEAPFKIRQRQQLNSVNNQQADVWVRHSADDTLPPAIEILNMLWRTYYDLWDIMILLLLVQSAWSDQLSQLSRLSQFGLFEEEVALCLKLQQRSKCPWDNWTLRMKKSGR